MIFGELKNISQELTAIGTENLHNILICFFSWFCRISKYLATINDDEELRKQSQSFYKTEFGIDIPLENIHCLGGRSEDIFYLCKECPFITCCKEHNTEMCSECCDYPCKKIKGYQEKYVNKCNQIN